MSYRCFACLWPNYCNHGDQSDIIILSSTDYWYTFLPLFSADSTVSGALKISLPSPCIFVHHLSLSVPSISTYKVCTGTFIGGAWVTTVMWLCWYNNRFMNSSVSLLMHSRTAALACRWKPYRLCLHCTGNHHGNRHKPNACVPEPLVPYTPHINLLLANLRNSAIDPPFINFKDIIPPSPWSICHGHQQHGEQHLLVGGPAQKMWFFSNRPDFISECSNLL